jgi:hypothetical protein
MRKVKEKIAPTQPSPIIQDWQEQDYYIQPVDISVSKYVILIALGAVAQLGERLNGIQEVVGSIPISSTSKINHLESLKATP